MSLRHALLGLLVDRTASGYDLMKLFDTSLAHVWPATQSQVYGELTRLADAGLLEVVGQGPRGRKDYALTDTGLTELRRWLADPSAEQPRRSDTLLRVFFIDVLPPEQRLEYLKHLADQAAGRHADLRKVRDTLDWAEEGRLTANGAIALEFGLRFTAMQEEWARWAAQLIASREGGTGAEGS
ncbi:PadR family transcriptional regulator [Streptomyces sp. NPDC056161]|uniref:PadR family transcriptional regulator n=1 Tax=Streptomyces sp. NPDC056161 TaxID=3345732 RepID=UPI0035D8E3B5